MDTAGCGAAWGAAVRKHTAARAVLDVHMGAFRDCCVTMPQTVSALASFTSDVLGADVQWGNGGRSGVVQSSPGPCTAGVPSLVGRQFITERGGCALGCTAKAGSCSSWPWKGAKTVNLYIHLASRLWY